MNEKEEQILDNQFYYLENNDIINFKTLFTDRSLQLVREERSELEESILDRLKTENEELLKSYSEMIDIL